MGAVNWIRDMGDQGTGKLGKEEHGIIIDHGLGHWVLWGSTTVDMGRKG